MAWRTILCVGALSGALAGCITGSHRENAALRMRWPVAPPAELVAYAPPDRDYPSTGGDILKGASPQEQTAARATAGAPVKP